jgi:hypothetical protein
MMKIRIVLIIITGLSILAIAATWLYPLLAEDTEPAPIMYYSARGDTDEGKSEKELPLPEKKDNIKENITWLIATSNALLWGIHQIKTISKGK